MDKQTPLAIAAPSLANANDRLRITVALDNARPGDVVGLLLAISIVIGWCWIAIPELAKQQRESTKRTYQASHQAPPSASTEGDTNETRDQRQATKNETANWALVIVGSITFFVIAWQAWETRKAAEASTRGAAIAERALFTTQRAFLFLDSFQTRAVAADGQITHWLIRVRFSNQGQTPALNVTSESGFTCIPNGTSEDFEIFLEDGGPAGTVGPRGTLYTPPIHISREMVQSLVDNNRTIFIYGAMVYSDTLPGTPRRHTLVCARLTLDSDDPFNDKRPFVFPAAGVKHNYAD